MTISPDVGYIFPMSKPDIIGTADAAALLGLTQDHLKLLARTKKIPSTKIGKTYFFSRDDVKKYKPGPVGRPKKQKD